MERFPTEIIIRRFADHNVKQVLLMLSLTESKVITSLNDFQTAMQNAKF